MSGVSEIRSTFLDYFKKNGHEIVPSSPLVPRNDPSLMFTNAGMVQFKNVFTALKSAPIPAPRPRKNASAPAASTMISTMSAIPRATTTFFEMLGNLSFGDYFKEEAITLAWNLITKEFSLPVDRLLVTVYHTDDEAFDLWKKIAGFPESKIIRIATSDNFWAMATPDPAVPVRNFYDQGDKLFGGPPGSADEDGDRFLEFWNLVFMQFEQVSPGERLALPRPSIDTGMGARAHRGAPARQDVKLRHRPDARADPRRGLRDRRRSRRAAEGEPSRHRGPSTRLAPFSSPMAFYPRMKGAAMYCAGSCAGRCAMRSFWARPSL